MMPATSSLPAGCWMQSEPSRAAPSVRWAALALMLWLSLVALLWPIPFMAWDHLDLVPMLQALHRGGLTGVDLLALHGGHYHSAAYLWLLASTLLSNGWPQAEVVSSLLLLALHAALLWRILDRAGVLAAAGRWRYLLLLLVLYPGHLANLQWGWQVAVFLCLAAVSATIERLSADTLTLRDNALAVLAALIACSSFASGLAILPVAIGLILLRSELNQRQRLLLITPWLLLAGGLTAHYLSQSAAGALQAPSIGLFLHYLLNFLGSGLFRSITDLAAVLVLLALLQLTLCLPRSAATRQARPLLALLLFSAGVAALTALGRAAYYGADHAFVTRYASFSVLFWIAWTGLLLQAFGRGSRLPRLPQTALALVTVVALFNALHLSGKAVQLAERMGRMAAALDASWPSADDHALAALYFDQPDEARRRLDQLCRWGYPPFSSQTRCRHPQGPAASAASGAP